jgi:hypothetical protein
MHFKFHLLNHLVVDEGIDVIKLLEAIIIMRIIYCIFKLLTIVRMPIVRRIIFLCLLGILAFNAQDQPGSSVSSSQTEALTSNLSELMIIHPFTPISDKYLYVSNVTIPIEKESGFCLNPTQIEWNNSTRIPQKEIIGESSFFDAIKIGKWVGLKKGIAIGVVVGYSAYKYARGDTLIPGQVWGKLRELYQNPSRLKKAVEVQMQLNLLR